jgi:hypothetical protein
VRELSCEVCFYCSDFSVVVECGVVGSFVLAVRPKYCSTRPAPPNQGRSGHANREPVTAVGHLSRRGAISSSATPGREQAPVAVSSLAHGPRPPSLPGLSLLALPLAAQVYIWAEVSITIPDTVAPGDFEQLWPQLRLSELAALPPGIADTSLSPSQFLHATKQRFSFLNLHLSSVEAECGHPASTWELTPLKPLPNRNSLSSV